MSARDSPSQVSTLPEPYGRVRRTVLRVLIQAGHLASCLLGDDVVSRRFRVWLLRLLGARISAGASIHGGGYLSRPGHLTVGRGTFVNRNCYLDLHDRLTLGARVTVGHGTTFVTTTHGIGPPTKRCGPAAGSPITVGEGAWVGANVTVLPGVTIGPGAVVAAGSVVVSDVVANMVVSGVPARVLRELGPVDEGGLDVQDAEALPR